MPTMEGTLISDKLRQSRWDASATFSSLDPDASNLLAIVDPTKSMMFCCFGLSQNESSFL
jgi:hypothetical protein